MTAADENRPVVLTSVPTELEGTLIVGRLEGEGIVAMLAGGGLAGWRAEVPAWVQVMVLQRDEARARELLSQWRNRMNSEDDD
ncbi:MAG TPA: DUF2007 domain-containing protein [Phycisphaerae bacterium]|nr:DUF2007 domain-containing protein [Phycisphaerae bacterium]